MSRILELTGNTSRLMLAALITGALGVAIGCQTTEYRTPTDASMAEFESAGPILPQINAGAFAGVNAATGPYRMVTGDVLSVQIAPREGGDYFSTVRSDAVQVGIPCRVSAEGTIQLPYATENLKVEGLTLLEVEKAIIDLYFPKYLKQAPLAYVQMREYQTQVVTVTGMVPKPGRYDLRSDRLTLLSALSEAGGTSQLGSSLVRVRKAGQEKPDEDKLIMIDTANGSSVKQDIQLSAGDNIEIVTIPPNTYTVIGLVKTPGKFDYNMNAGVSLVQAIAMAGGTDWTAEPHFARIYRRTAEGKLVSADFVLDDNKTLLGGASVMLKPGDVVALENTDRTAARVVFDKVVKVTFRVDTGVQAISGGAGSSFLH